jgi:hypothetical protein
VSRTPDRTECIADMTLIFLHYEYWPEDVVLLFRALSVSVLYRSAGSAWLLGSK